MRCEQVRDRIGMLVDGELAAGERDAVIEHAAGCAECGHYRNELLRLRHHLQQARKAAPSGLSDRISARLSVAALDMGSRGDETPAEPRSRWTRTAFMQGLARYIPQAAAVLLACAISIAGTLWWTHRTDQQESLAHDVLAAHVRSLLQDNAVQIASLDTHTVKPWFAGRLEFSPVVKDLSSEGFQLIGGRLDYVDGQRVAALVYRRRLHQISVFVWPSPDRSAPAYSARVDGFNLLGWSKASLTYWAVSDLNEGELRELQALY
jgi:anti-sigma factor RsiW